MLNPWAIWALFPWCLPSSLNSWLHCLRISLLLPNWLRRRRKASLLANCYMSSGLNPGLSSLPILLSHRWLHKLSLVVNTISILIVSKFVSLLQTSLLNFRLALLTACLIFLLGCFTGISSSILIFSPSHLSTILLPRNHLILLFPSHLSVIH